MGIRRTDNLGDVAISEMIATLFHERGVGVEHLDFNFSAVVAGFFHRRPGQGRRSRAGRSGNRWLRIVARLARFLGTLPIVFLAFLPKSRGIEQVFIGGGNILMGIEHGFPLQALAFVLFSRLLGKRVTFLCVGAGPFTAPGVKAVLRLALRWSELVVCRDSRSKELIETELAPPHIPVEVLPDPVLLWPRHEAGAETLYDVLFTVMPLYSPAIFPDGDVARMRNFRACLVDLAVALIGQGRRVGMMVTDPAVDLEMSEGIVAEIERRTGTRPPLKVPVSPEEMAALAAAAVTVFSTRMHGAIMALSQSVPALCVSWQPKVRGLYRDLGLNELLVGLDEDGGFVLDEVLAKLTKIFAERSSFQSRIEARLAELRGEYRRLWGRL